MVAPVVRGVSIDEAQARWRDVMTAEGKSIRTIDSYCERLTAVAKHCGWSTIAQVDHEHMMGFLAHRMRGEHGGTPWQSAACRSTVSALKHFGGFIKSIRGVDPFDGAKLPKKRAAKHKHPYAVDEAKRQLLSSFRRQQRDARAKGHPTLFAATLFWTGLRHSEMEKPGAENPYGGLKWRDITLEGEFPGIWTDPAWIGNKSKTRDWLPLFPRLRRLLLAHRETVLHRPDDPVFPIFMTRPTWVDDRDRAGLPAYDAEGRALSVHATRASYCTWIGKLVLPEGLRDRLCRHHGSISEWTYGEREKREMADAVAQLPDIWPDLGGPGGFTDCNPKNLFPHSTKELASGNPIGYIVGAASYEHPHSQLTSAPHPRDAAHHGADAVCLGAEAFGGRDSVEPVVAPQSDPLSLISGFELDRATAKQTLDSLNRLIRILTPDDSRRGVVDGKGQSQQGQAS